MSFLTGSRFSRPRRASSESCVRKRLKETVWHFCPQCRCLVARDAWFGAGKACQACGYHARIGSRERMRQLVDVGSFVELNAGLRAQDPLRFVDTRPYVERLREAYDGGRRDEAVLTGTGCIGGIPVALAVMDFDFLGGSMGCVVGERVARLIEHATAHALPLVMVTASGGARMQEGVLSLMQLANTTMAFTRYRACRRLAVAVLTDPTMGGVTASFPSLADVILAEPGARIGFAGRRVIEQILRQSLGADFQVAEALLRDGLIDQIVPRWQLRGELMRLLRLHAPKPVGAGSLALVGTVQ